MAVPLSRGRVESHTGSTLDSLVCRPSWAGWFCNKGFKNRRPLKISCWSAATGLRMRGGRLSFKGMKGIESTGSGGDIQLELVELGCRGMSMSLYRQVGDFLRVFWRVACLARPAMCLSPGQSWWRLLSSESEMVCSLCITGKNVLMRFMYYAYNLLTTWFPMFLMYDKLEVKSRQGFRVRLI